MPRGLSRRSFGLGVTAALLLRCQRHASAGSGGSPQEPAPRASGAPASTPPGGAPPRPLLGTRLLDWSFDGVSPRCAVLLPESRDPAARYPVLVALHGRTEAKRPPAGGALAWPRDYALTHAYERVGAPPLTATDFEGFVEASRLATLNRMLAERPFGGLIVACPYVPDVDLGSDTEVAAFGRFIRETLLPRVRRETPALSDPSATGIDGVSLGGVLSLAVGLDGATSFGAVGTLQPAVDVHDAARWTARAQAARRANPKLALRLVTSDGDYFRDAVRATSNAWNAAGVSHELEQLLGPHDYPFNRGPGAIEMLIWHDRVLRRGA